MNIIIQKLVNSYAVLVLAGRKTIEDVPASYTLAGTTYNLRELVDIEVAERTIAALS